MLSKKKKKKKKTKMVIYGAINTYNNIIKLPKEPSIAFFTTALGYTLYSGRNNVIEKVQDTGSFISKNADEISFGISALTLGTMIYHNK